MKIVLTLQIPWNVPEEPLGFPRHLLRTTDLAHVTVLRIWDVQKHMTHLMLSVSEREKLVHKFWPYNWALVECMAQCYQSVRKQWSSVLGRRARRKMPPKRSYLSTVWKENSDYSIAHTSKNPLLRRANATVFTILNHGVVIMTHINYF